MRSDDRATGRRGGDRRRAGRAAAALGAAAGVLLLAACTSSPAPTTTATATVTATDASAPTASSTPATSAPSTSTSAAPTSSAAPSAGASGGSATSDPDRPDGQCADSALRVSLRAYGNSAGHVISQFVFTNTGSSSCVLRGYPGVSVVGHGSGAQVGAPAGRDDAPVKTVTLPAGTSQTTAILQSVDIGTDGGPLGSRCPAVAADGYRVYPPHSTKAVFVRASGLHACTSRVVWMTIAPVTDTTK